MNITPEQHAHLLDLVSFQQERADTPTDPKTPEEAEFVLLYPSTEFTPVFTNFYPETGALTMTTEGDPGLLEALLATIGTASA